MAIGLVVAKTALDPIEVVRKLRSILRERPWEFRYILKVVPIEKVVKADVDALKGQAGEMAKGIGAEESYRITVEKRHSALSRKDVIDGMASSIERSVDLEEPKKILMVQVIGEQAGVSLLEPGDVLSVEVEKRGSRLAPSRK